MDAESLMRACRAAGLSERAGPLLFRFTHIQCHLEHFIRHKVRFLCRITKELICNVPFVRLHSKREVIRRDARTSRPSSTRPFSTSSSTVINICISSWCLEVAALGGCFVKKQVSYHL